MLKRLAVVCLLSLAAACSSSDGDEDAADDSALTDATELAGPLAADTRLVTTANVNFRSAPAIGSNVIRVLPSGTPVVAEGGDANNGFFAVKYSGRSGFISAKYLKKNTGTGNGGNGTGSRVTYIGDSHSDFEGSGGSFGVLGFKVNEHLKELGLNVAIFAASSSAPNWWFDDTSDQAATWGYTQTVSEPARRTCSRSGRSAPCVPKLSAILSERPSLFIIEQGSNLLGRTTGDITNQIRTMLAKIDGKVDACLWLGAPTARASKFSEDSQEELWQLISQHAAPTCYVYDSRFVPRAGANGEPELDAQGNLVMDEPLPYSGSDGLHFDSAGANKWAKGVNIMIDWVRKKTSRTGPAPQQLGDAGTD